MFIINPIFIDLDHLQIKNFFRTVLNMCLKSIYPLKTERWKMALEAHTIAHISGSKDCCQDMGHSTWNLGFWTWYMTIRGSTGLAKKRKRPKNCNAFDESFSQFALPAFLSIWIGASFWNCISYAPSLPFIWPASVLVCIRIPIRIRIRICFYIPAHVLAA